MLAGTSSSSRPAVAQVRAPETQLAPRVGSDLRQVSSSRLQVHSMATPREVSVAEAIPKAATEEAKRIGLTETDLGKIARLLGPAPSAMGPKGEGRVSKPQAKSQIASHRPAADLFSAPTLEEELGEPDREETEPPLKRSTKPDNRATTTFPSVC